MRRVRTDHKIILSFNCTIYKMDIFNVTLQMKIFSCIELFLYVEFHISFRYLQGRGNTKRHTMANPEDVHSLQSSSSSGGSRTRRTGLLTVMERPPGKFNV